ncbi:MmgE/PrpD family protein [Noviherbaspirillum sp.]|uniref:MmgE/PrpD family protein n=1 Tax=Noviherbaspirillum sp. TaxID=1926288 RepID=UPI002B48A9D3|nr:MmgE/PrpD family protein [Noviherbaspirillum sp.]HJV82034.1 MmgE/PrpD family protein [Noviherbaspirillum sp.]
MKRETPPINLTRLLADFCADYALHHQFPESAIRLAELAIVDTAGCILAGVNDPAVVKIGDTIPDEQSGRSRRSKSVRHAFPVSARDAAAVNGCAAHARELDDNVLPAVIHSSAVLTPALFALGEEIGASGADIVRAFIVGKEVNAHIGSLVNPTHYELGWNTNSTIGVFGAAAACATLLKLDSDQIVHALSLAFSMSSGGSLQFGSEAKPLHCGMAAEWGVWAARLAQKGFEGNTNVLQGKWSFQELYAGGKGCAPYHAVLFPDAPLAIDAYPPVAKLYPCCGSSHLGIDAIRALRARQAFTLEDIERVDVHMLKIMNETLRYRIPANEKEARFSMPYCAAVTLVDGMPTLAHFTQRAVTEPEPAVARLLPLVHTHVRDPSPEVLAKRLIFQGDCLVEVHLRSGEVLKQIAEHPKGCKENPLTPDERRAKFLDCVREQMDEAGAMQLYGDLLDLFHLEAIDGITSSFRAMALTL